MRSEQAARIFILALLVLTLYLLYLIFKPFLPAIAWAIFFATAFHPVYRGLARLLRGREWAAAILTTLLVAALIVLPAVLVATNLARNLGTLLPQLESRVRAPAAAAPQSPDGAPPGPVESVEPARLPFVREIESVLGPYVDVESLDLQGTAVAAIKRTGQYLASQSSKLVQNVLWSVLGFTIMIFTMIVLLREGAKVLDACRRFLPLREPDKDEAFRLLHEVTRAVFYGVMLTALVQASLGTIGWLVVGLPAPTTFGILMFFCALLPFGGTSLVWGPGALWLLLQGHPVKALVLLLWGVLVVGLVDNVLRPIFVSGRIRMHALLVFFGILGGMTAFGFVGLFVGPMVITFCLFLLEVVRRDLFQPEGAPTSGASPSSPG